MSKQNFRTLRHVLITTFLLSGAGGFVSVARAQVTGSGLNTTVNVVGNNFNITGGTRPSNGPNLFHSFGNFGLNTPESAVFLNDSGLATRNILSRVTGGNPSNIFGTIDTSSFGSANLFLMNPAGIVFGPTAQLNVGGSFHATTADYIRLDDGSRFNAVPSGADALLTTAPPAAFGFLTSNPKPIDVQTGIFDPNTGQFMSLLQVPVGNTLSLVGGTLNLGTPEVRNAAGDVVEDAKPALVLAPGGRINLVSVASAGEAIFDGKGFNVDGFSQLGDINIKGGQIFGGALMFPSYIDGKEVFIRGGQLVIDNALIFPGFFSLFGLAPPPDGGEVNVKVRGAVNITGTDVEPFVGNAPGIVTFAGSFFAPPEFFPDAKVPDITIDAGSLTIAGQASVQTARFGPGEPSNVVVNADTVTVKNGGSISLLNFYEGSGGALTINAREVNLSGDGTPSPTGITGLAVQGLTHPCFGCALPSGEPDFDPRLILADSGSITVNATDRVNMSGDAVIVTDSLAFGNGGDITVNTKDMFLSGAGEQFTGRIQAQTVLGGRSGNITINATGRIEESNGFGIGASTSSNSDGGTVNVSAGQSITMTGADTGIASVTAQATDETLNAIFLNWLHVDFKTLAEATGVPNANMFDVLAFLNSLGVTNITDLTPGNAGTINIRTPLLTMNADTRIATSTAWDGNAGQVVGNFGSLLMQDGAAIRSQSGIVDSGQLFLGAGNAGLISLSAADTIMVSGRSPTSGEGSSISTTTFGDGAAGNISLSASQVNVQNGGTVTSTSGGTVNGRLFVGAGNAGTVNMTGTDISVSGTGSTVSTSTLGDGNGGDVSLNAGNSVSIVNGGLVSADSLGGAGLAGNITIAAGDQIVMDSGSVSTRAITADGGNITLNAPNLIQLTNSQITTSVESGEGGGGNITIDPQALILNNSKILANAFGGPGGNINITADVFLVNSNGAFPTSLTGIVDASSALNTPGTVNIQANFTNVTGSVTLLPETPLKATELLRAACAARFAGGKTSSLVLGGRDGLPSQPGDLLPSPLYLASDANTAAPGATTMTGYTQFSDLSFLGSRDQRLDRYTLLPNSKCS